MRLRELKADGESLADIAEAVDATWVDGRKPWAEECDIAMPAATQNELDEEDAQQLLEHGCRAIVEGANMPLTDPAASKLSNAGVLIAPGKAANAGGVAVSGFEMSQNRIGVSWSAERLDEELRDVMRSIYERTREAGRKGDSIDYRRGADIAGFKRVSGALLAFGYL